ncbi:MAG TPA: putative toxin-antitoxin system toxin component, PIN family [Egibacteraceae bacterium]|nr:putative toxin-antitoxin system toxin component, PIN family [Egibacteraceae bacterium]
MRLVLDPNVLVSAVVADGVSRRLLDAWRVERRYELIVCPLLLDELDDVLSRDRFHRFITPDEREALMALLRSDATAVADPEVIEPVTADPDDDYLVALAQRENTDALVSGDSDLTGIAKPNPPVLTPAEALDRLELTG